VSPKGLPAQARVDRPRFQTKARAPPPHEAASAQEKQQTAPAQLPTTDAARIRPLGAQIAAVAAAGEAAAQGTQQPAREEAVARRHHPPA